MIEMLERGSSDDLAAIVVNAAAFDDGAAAREHIAVGFPVYFSETDTPEGMVIKAYPDGRQEFVRFDLEGEHFVKRAA